MQCLPSLSTVAEKHLKQLHFTLYLYNRATLIEVLSFAFVLFILTHYDEMNIMILMLAIVALHVLTFALCFLCWAAWCMIPHMTKEFSKRTSLSSV